MERQEFFEGAPRNVAEARTRSGLEQARLQAGRDAEIRNQNGNAINGPSGDEVLPAFSDAALLGNTSFPASDPTWNTFSNPSTSKREAQGVPPDAPE